ncbi:allatostatin-A receptor-like [Lingula anatina]|uniref:Allatostatin-A receptor-like n=1 Tax=Lingula anatina TaxID=7574 RepID=A0A1S3HKE5_LINAN|nr:allatostatin-A receptor-like [Lingula anatina]|eukprot:XP_013385936.1 allatostatin-A receptor-like [Lingula anatina]
MPYLNGTGIEANITKFEAASRWENAVFVTVAVLFSVIAAIGFVGNSLVLVVLLNNRPMRTTTNILIANLAVADLCFIVFCVPFTATMYILDYWPFGRFWCRFVYYLIYVSAWASIYTLVIMAVDRFFTLVLVFHSLTLKTRRNTVILLVIIWVVLCLVNLPAYYEHDQHVYSFGNDIRIKCLDYNLMFDIEKARLFYFFFFAFGYALPLVTIVAMYTVIVYRLYWHRCPERARTAEISKAKRRLTRVAIIVTAVFALCWLPIQVAFLLRLQWAIPDESLKSFLYFQLFATCLAYTNSCINPILYAFVYANFRKGFYRVIFCKKGHELGMDSNSRRSTGRSRFGDEMHPLRDMSEVTTIEGVHI